MHSLLVEGASRNRRGAPVVSGIGRCRWRPARTNRGTNRTTKAERPTRRGCASPRARAGSRPRPGSDQLVVRLPESKCSTSSWRTKPTPINCRTRMLRSRVCSDAQSTGFDRMLAEQREAWAGRWEDADIVIEGDDELQVATRWSLFQLMAAIGDGPEAAVGARGLSGSGYRGHVFWDADTFVLPFLAATHPASARAMLEYRIRRLPAAREAARAAESPRRAVPVGVGAHRSRRHALIGTRSLRARSSRSAPASSKSTSLPTSRGPRAVTSTGPATTRSPTGPG